MSAPPPPASTANAAAPAPQPQGKKRKHHSGTHARANSAGGSVVVAASSAVHPSAKQPRTQQQRQGQSGAATPGLFTPLAPHRTLARFYPAGTVTRCPCMLSRHSRILVVGDGDLSFSIGLVRHLCSKQHAQYEEQGFAGDDDSFDSVMTPEQANSFFASSDPDPTDPASFVVPPSSLQLTCTTYEDAPALLERYGDSGTWAQELRSWGIKVLHGVDATALAGRLEELEPLATLQAREAGTAAAGVGPPATPRFHHVIFNFPHVGGKSRNHLNRALLSGFLASASQHMLVRKGDPVWTQARPGAAAPHSATSASDTASCAYTSPAAACVERAGGCIHVALLRGQGGTPSDPTSRPRYADHWQLLECATQVAVTPSTPQVTSYATSAASASSSVAASSPAVVGGGLVLSHVLSFHKRLYPGYSDVGFRSRDEEFSERRGTSITHVLVADATATADLASSREGSTPSLPQHMDVRDAACSMHGCASAVCARSISTAALPPETRRLLARDFTSQRDHPLAQVRRMLETHLNMRSDESALPTGVTRTPFDDSTTSFIRLRREGDSDGSHLSACSRLSTHSSSSISVVQELEEHPSVHSVQWNLEPVLAVAGDLEAAVPEPLCVGIERQQAAVPVSIDAPPTGAVVPLMRGGVPVLHYMLMDQQFQVTEACSTADIGGTIQSDLDATSKAIMRALFGATAAVHVRSTTAAASSFDVLVRHTDGVWHTVGTAVVVVGTQAESSRWTLEVSLDKLAMLRWAIPDVRWLWSEDERVTSQWHALDLAASGSGNSPVHFVPFSLHALAFVRDNSFWLNPVPPEAREGGASHATSSPTSPSPMSAPTRTRIDESTFVRAYTRALLAVSGPSVCCSLRVTDRFTHPVRGEACRLRLVYHAVERAVSVVDVSRMQAEVHARVIGETGVEIR